MSAAVFCFSFLVEEEHRTCEDWVAENYSGLIQNFTYSRVDANFNVGIARCRILKSAYSDFICRKVAVLPMQFCEFFGKLNDELVPFLNDLDTYRHCTYWIYFNGYTRDDVVWNYVIAKGRHHLLLDSFISDWPQMYANDLLDENTSKLNPKEFCTRINKNLPQIIKSRLNTSIDNVRYDYDIPEDEE